MFVSVVIGSLVVLRHNLSEELSNEGTSGIVYIINIRPIGVSVKPICLLINNFSSKLIYMKINGEFFYFEIQCERVRYILKVNIKIDH